MRIKVLTVETQGFYDSLAYYLKNVPLTVEEALKLRMRKLLERANRWFPPKNKSQGLKAVSGDFYKSAVPLNPKNFERKDIRKMITSQDLVPLQKIVDNSDSPFLKGREVIVFDKNQHERNRSRDGRVRFDKNKLAVNRREWMAQKKKSQKNVGLVKSAFAMVIERLGGKSAPAWLRRPWVYGLKFDFVHKTKKHIAVVNRAFWSHKYDYHIANAAKTEEKAMMADLRFRLKQEAKKAGLDR